MRKFLKKIAYVLILALVIPSLADLIPAVHLLTAKTVYAAETTSSLGKKDYTIGINSLPEYIEINSNDYKSIFLYKSADPAIAKVDRDGSLTGVAKGKTTVNIKETVNGIVCDLGNVTVNVVAAKLDCKSTIIGLNATENVPLNYTDSSAVYQYKSTNTKAVTVDKNGTMNGLKMGGKAKINVTEINNGKTSKVGSLEVTVGHASLMDKEMKIGLTEQESIALDNMNPNATYTYSSSNKKTVTADNQGYIIGKKLGTSKISVTETYKHKTVKIGTIQVKVIPSFIDKASKSIEIGINSKNRILDTIGIDHAIYDNTFVYSCVSADNNIVAVGKDENQNTEFGPYYFTGKVCGKTTLTIYETYKNKKRTVGTVNVTVSEIPIVDLSFDNYFFDKDSAGNLSYTYYMNYGTDYYDSITNYLTKEPYNTSTPVTYQSSDDKVIKIDSEGRITLVGVGTAKITVTCGKLTVSYTAVVKSEP